jgi:hypothetical protein
MFEEHGDGRQLVRFALRPRIRGWVIPCAALVAAAGVAAAGAGAWIAACPLLAAGVWLAVASVYECCLATGSALDAIASEDGS